MANPIHKPMAVLLVYPTDTPESSNRPKVDFYRDLFVNSDISIHKYWKTMSDGNMDLEGTQVFNWRSHGMTRSQFMQLSRFEKIRRVVDVFANEGLENTRINLLNFDSVIIFGDPSDELGSVSRYNFNVNGVTHNMGTAIFNIGTDHRTICHEIGHVLNFDHSFDDNNVAIFPGNDSRPGAYGDWWDIMSANNVASYSTKFGWAGPGLNTVMRDIVGWLLPSRIIDGNNLKNETVKIFDNTSVDSSLPHVLRIEDLYFEFTMNTGWYAGINSPSVQMRVMDFNQGVHSKLLTASLANKVLLLNDDFFQEYKSSRYYRKLSVKFSSIDYNEKSATLEVTHIINFVSYIDPNYHIKKIQSDIQVLIEDNVIQLPQKLIFKSLMNSIGILALLNDMDDGEQKKEMYKAMSRLIENQLEKLQTKSR